MAIKEMNRVGIIVDIAHTGWQTCLDAIKVSSKPVVASHSVCHELNHNHYRSKNDEIIKAIADNGGFMGICSLQKFIGGNGGIQDFINHIDYVGKKFGADYVAIATDRGYSCPVKGFSYDKLPDFPRKKPIWEKLHREKEYSASELATFEKTLPELAWTNWPLYTVALVQRGYSDSDIRKILGENVLRVAKEALKGTAYIPTTV
jgi:membrane dipeptidase